jgi:hypothetical protein
MACLGLGITGRTTASSLLGKVFGRLFGKAPIAAASPQPQLLNKVKSVKQVDYDKGIEGPDDDSTVYIPSSQIKAISDKQGVVKDGKW